MAKKRKRHIKFQVDGELEVPCGTTDEQILQALKDFFYIDPYYDEENPLQGDGQTYMEDHIEYNFVTTIE